VDFWGSTSKDDSGHSSTNPSDASFGQDPVLRTVFGRTSERGTALPAKARSPHGGNLMLYHGLADPGCLAAVHRGLLRLGGAAW
jgi:hypothetical protein